MRRIGTLAVAGTLLAPCAVAAQSPATIRGQVYDCMTGQPMARATVELRNLDDGMTLTQTAANDGRFARVGLQPGRYLISVTGPPVKQDPIHAHINATTASRLARVDTDDVLDVRIGTYQPLKIVSVHRAREAVALLPLAPNEPHPACDPAFVPAAPPTSDRYVIH